MKKISILFCLSICFGMARAQCFFYIDNNQITDNLARDGLLKASQFITRSPLSSDYIVKTEMNFQTGVNTLTLEINLQDTVTSQTVFQGKETLAFGELRANTRRMLNTVIRAFIDRNINQIILSARENHFDDQSKWLRVRKDKT
ncbi:MAG TPA: hypothetical protein VII28_09430 [Puia sp.]